MAVRQITLAAQSASVAVGEGFEPPGDATLRLNLNQVQSTTLPAHLLLYIGPAASGVNLGLPTHFRIPQSTSLRIDVDRGMLLPMTTNPGLQDVRTRREAIARESASLVKRVDALRNEDAELAQVEEVLTRLARSQMHLDVAPAPQPRAVEKSRERAPEARETFADAVRSIMDASEKTWWTAVEIRVELCRRWERDVPQTSLSPQLSKMKDAGKIVRDGMKIALPDRVPNLLALSDQSENSGSAEPEEAKGEDAGGISPLHNPNPMPAGQ